MLLCLLLCLLILNAKATNLKAFPLTFEDSTGNKIALNATPKKIISLYSAFNEIMLAIGAHDKICAKTVQDTNPSLAHLPNIGTHMRPNLELIAAEKPDLIIQLHGRTDASLQAEALRKLGFTVAQFKLNSFKDVFDVTSILGEITGQTAQAYSTISTWQNRLKEIGARNLGGKTIKVIFEIRSPELLVAGTNNIVSEIIQIAGGQNIISIPKKIVRINEEEIIRLDPDAYVIQKGPMNPNPIPLIDRPNLRILTAAQNGRSLIVNEELFSRPGPLAIDACDLLEKWLHSSNKNDNDAKNE